MKNDKHPDYNLVCFEDVSTGKKFLSRSTMRAKDMITVDGNEYFHVKCDVTSDSHPAYTGQKRFVDTAGRVDKFQTKFGSRKRA